MARLSPDKCIFLVCDVQERFRSAIHNFPAVLSGSQRMLKAAIELKIPTIVTEQYPKGLGKTVDELDGSHAEVFEKTTFTMLCPASWATANNEIRNLCFVERAIVCPWPV